MFLQSRVITVWLFWLIGGVCGVVILLVIICYCRLMPRHQKSIDEQYHKENYKIKENYAYSSRDNNYRVKHEEVQTSRHSRPASYAGAAAAAAPPARHASSGGLAEAEASAAAALKTRSLPAACSLRAVEGGAEGAEGAGPRRQRSRMRSEHAALIALSLARARPPDEHAPAAVVSDQRTRL